MPDKVGIGIIGCGHMAQTHAQILSALPNARLVGHCPRHQSHRVDPGRVSSEGLGIRAEGRGAPFRTCSAP